MHIGTMQIPPPLLWSLISFCAIRLHCSGFLCFRVTQLLSPSVRCSPRFPTQLLVWLSRFLRTAYSVMFKVTGICVF